MRPPRGTLPLVVLLLIYLGFVFGRSRLFHPERPAIVVEKPRGVRVMFGEGFPQGGIHQFSDDIDLFSAIKLTGLPVGQNVLMSAVGDLPAIDGGSLALIENNNEIIGIECGWMPAAQRMALGIPLHPDRMSRSDWEALPGIGPRLAARIEEDRQKNGDFCSLNVLIRVSGIGAKSIAKWRGFFE